MIFIDANLFIAYANKDDVLHKNAVLLFEKIEQLKWGEYFTSDYIFNEVVGVINRKCGKEKAILIGDHILVNLVIISVKDHIFKEAWKIFIESELSLNFVDCTNLAILKITNTRYIATFDNEFKNVKDIAVVQ
jgi:predicted nucleic acid-binding protein